MINTWTLVKALSTTDSRECVSCECRCWNLVHYLPEFLYFMSHILQENIVIVHDIHRGYRTCWNGSRITEEYIRCIVSSFYFPTLFPPDSEVTFILIRISCRLGMALVNLSSLTNQLSMLLTVRVCFMLLLLSIYVHQFNSQRTSYNRAGPLWRMVLLVLRESRR